MTTANRPNTDPAVLCSCVLHLMMRAWPELSDSARTDVIDLLSGSLEYDELQLLRGDLDWLAGQVTS